MGTIKRVFRPGVIVVMALTGIGSRILDGLDAKQVGLPYWAWEGIAIAVAVGIVVAMLVGFQRRLEVSETRNTGVRDNDTEPLTQAVESGEDTTQRDTPQSFAAEYKRLAVWDSADMGSRVLVHSTLTSAAVRGQAKPFIDFTFSIFNGCVFPVQLDTRAEGWIVGGGQRLDNIPDILRTMDYEKPFPHGHGHILKIRQQLSDQDANRLCAYQGASVPFDFTHLTVWMWGQLMDGKPTEKARLGLTHTEALQAGFHL